ncbi:MAG: hypothetical protein HC886_13690 [Leptolyngbyaceae cyanobacterium SM1_1_3]|nr:hypothetical protein [Leptolyngbyaceae cyanobacterium SM1_1_3]NJN04277.1 hypothetical protein [Leptolyngbyaceae cyanobacterium RM1_1_2]NJO08506.1 hypothetical protein [Leptolyngbyaceae cyanobacterium SL_1_1]
MFEDRTVIYAVRSEPLRTAERNGKTFTVHPVVGLYEEKPGQEVEDLLSEGDRRTCAIASDYSELACGYIDTSSMLYTR